VRKTSRKPKNQLRALEAAARRNESGPYELKLFVTGSTPRSREAIARIKQLCEQELKDRYTLEVIDVHQEPQLAQEDQIVALPTLLKKLPLPLRRILGEFSDKDRLLAVLGLTPVKKAT
jgi:circadian clock protein KaiB